MTKPSMEKETINLARRINIIKEYAKGKITRHRAAVKLGVTERHIARLAKRYREEGEEGLIHHNTGHKASNRIPDELKAKIIEIYNTKYKKYQLNFHHLKDKLLEEDGIDIPYTSLRRIMSENNIKTPKPYHKKSKPHPPRARRLCAGELLQVDASKHQWFHGIETYQYLHGGIDDNSGTVTGLWLEEQETIHGYQMILEQTIRDYGISECLYTDYRTVFDTNQKISDEERLLGKEKNATRFATALQRLGIGIISTGDPRAKGRIERLWKTLQDRLYKELWMRQITTIDEANTYIKEQFLPAFNAEFAQPINQSKNLFVKVPASFDYNRELSICLCKRQLHNECYVAYEHKAYVLQKHGKNIKLNYHGEVFLYKFLDQTMHIIHDGVWYDLIGSDNTPHENTEPKLGPNNDNVHQKQPAITLDKTTNKGSKNSPWHNSTRRFYSRKKLREISSDNA